MTKKKRKKKVKKDKSTFSMSPREKNRRSIEEDLLATPVKSLFAGLKKKKTK